MNSATATMEVVEREEIVAVARHVARQELGPLALRLDDQEPGAVEAAWEQVSEIGFDRALLTEDQGGVGLDRDSLLLCLEELAAGEAGVAMLVLLSNVALTLLPPDRVSEINAGERWAVVPSLAARISPGAAGADGIVILESGDQPVIKVAGPGNNGLRVEPCRDQLGLRAAVAAGIGPAETGKEPIESVPVSPAAAEAALALLRAGAAAIARGVARRASELALEYAETRRQGGVEIIEHDAVRDMLAGMSVRDQATRLPDGSALAARTALKAKVAATEAAVATTTDAVQVFGGTGYMHETGVEKLMRDAKYLQLWPEPNWTAADELLAFAGPGNLA